MTVLRILDDVIELEGQPVARLLPRLSPTLVYRLTEAFDAALDEAEEDIAQLEETIAQLEDRIAALEEQLMEPAR